MPRLALDWRRRAALVGALLLIVLVVAVVTQPGRPAGSVGAVAGASPGASSVAALFNGSFDGFPIDSQLPEPWQVTNPASATIVALPTSVDRSVRLRSDSTGAVTRACRPIIDALPDAALQVELDVLVESLPRVSPSALVTVQRGGQAVAGIELEPSGTVTDATISPGLRGAGAPQGPAAAPAGGTTPSGGAAGPGGTFLTSHWYHVSMALDRASRTYSWEAVGADGAPIASVGPEPLGDPSAASVDAVCIASPAGARSGAIVVNDLLVRE